MVRWYHAIFGAYGFWLPNDPRGSWSDFVHAWELFRFGGPATKVSERRSYAHDPHDAAHRVEMKTHLKYPPVRFDESCRFSIANGFAQACVEFGFRLHACAVGFDHVHVVASRDEHRTIEQVVAALKARATRRMNQDQTHPQLATAPSGATPAAWGKSCWRVYIDDEHQLQTAVAYVARHPMKEGLEAQPWCFLTPV